MEVTIQDKSFSKKQKTKQKTNVVKNNQNKTKHKTGA